MKPFKLFIVTIIIWSQAFAQTNTFPSSGNVGLGTTSPAQLLDVNGQSIFRNNLTLNFGTTNRTVQIRDNGLYISRTSEGSYVSTITADGSMTYNTRDNHSFYSDGQHILTMLNGGNVGIGTTAPSFKLDVNGSARFSGTTYLQGSLNYVSQGLTDINNSNARLDFPGDGTVGITTGTSSAARKLTVLANGTVGIGTTSPVSILDVVTGVGNGTTNEANCLRLRSNATTSNTMLLQMGVSNVGIGGNNNGYGYIGATYWGASDNNPLVLNPKGGPVGIGLTSGVLWPATVNSTVAIRATGPTAGNTLIGKLVFAHYGPYGGNSSFIAGVYDKANFYQGVGMVFHTISGSDVSGLDGVERMRISSDGNVGIGTNSPSAQLHTTGTVRFSGLSNDNTFTRVAVTDANGNLAYRDASTLGGSSGWSYDGSTVGVLKKIGTIDNYALPFITNNVERMRIGTNGNIGIGTTGISDANYKLFVETGIRTRKVKVDQTTWADYVFYPTYKLPSLQEVEYYIKEHQHLPDIPSAKEVEKNGLDLGNTQAALLKKIEELTLYVIEIKKENEEMKKEIKQLQKRK